MSRASIVSPISTPGHNTSGITRGIPQGGGSRQSRGATDERSSNDNAEGKERSRIFDPDESSEEFDNAEQPSHVPGRSDPHDDLACAVAAPNTTEATREDGLPIGSLPPPRDLKVVKKRLPPFMRRTTGFGAGVCWSRQEKRNEQLRRTLSRKTPNPLYGRADRC
ncbi:hypothetical protein NDU88_000268 [Pleurodeles waltl]|uniref:Uncharacterized protein n=1 Tax=Pleurodeles waltl TaxID=8319 RepID=A0AAV7V8J0_PLEWA|nr:hypothetical protein NDU88_000268 [Pleurodeles waltl]